MSIKPIKYNDEYYNKLKNQFLRDLYIDQINRITSIMEERQLQVKCLESQVMSVESEIRELYNKSLVLNEQLNQLPPEEKYDDI